jgi:hypothetical protein
MSENLPNERRPRLFLYSMLLPGLWIALGLFLLKFIPDLEFGSGGTVVVTLTVAWIISKHFAKTHGRQFSRHERLRLILYCSLWAIGMEIVALHGYELDQQEMGAPSMSGNYLFWGVVIAGVLDTLIIWFVFTWWIPRGIEFYLQKNVDPARRFWP